MSQVSSGSRILSDSIHSISRRSRRSSARPEVWQPREIGGSLEVFLSPAAQRGHSRNGTPRNAVRGETRSELHSEEKRREAKRSAEERRTKTFEMGMVGMVGTQDGQDARDCTGLHGTARDGRVLVCQFVCFGSFSGAPVKDGCSSLSGALGS